MQADAVPDSPDNPRSDTRDDKFGLATAAYNRRPLLEELAVEEVIE